MAERRRFDRGGHGGWQRGAPAVVAMAAFAFVLWRLVRSDRPQPAVASGTETSDRRASAPPRLTSNRQLASAHARPPLGRPLPEGTRVPPSSEGPGPHLLRYGGRSGKLAATTTVARADNIVQVSSLAKQPELVVWLPRLRVGAAGTPIFARL